MSIRNFFEKIGHAIKTGAIAFEHGVETVATDVRDVFEKLFGKQALTDIETAAESLIQSDFGKAILADAEGLLADLKSGRITVATAIVNLASDIVTLGEKVGHSIGQLLATTVASLDRGQGARRFAAACDAHHTRFQLRGFAEGCASSSPHTGHATRSTRAGYACNGGCTPHNFRPLDWGLTRLWRGELSARRHLDSATAMTPATARRWRAPTARAPLPDTARYVPSGSAPA